MTSTCLLDNVAVENFMKMLENWSAKAICLFKITGICFYMKF